MTKKDNQFDDIENSVNARKQNKGKQNWRIILGLILLSIAIIKLISWIL